MKKIMVLMLVLCMFFNMFTVTSFALTTEDETIVYQNENLNGELTRTVKADGMIISEWRGADGEVACTILYPGGRLYADGKLVGVLSVEQNRSSNEIGIYRLFALPNNINWGNWTNFSEKIHTGGQPAAVITSMIGIVCPEGIPQLTADMITQIQLSYDYLELRGRIRYGTDETYSYFQRYSNLYGNGLTKEKIFPNEVYNEGRERL